VVGIGTNLQPLAGNVSLYRWANYLQHIVVTWGNETNVATGPNAVTVTLKYQYVSTT